MDISKLMETVKNGPNYEKVGMILCHHGVVRGTSRDGRRVSGLSVETDHATLKQILDDHRKKPGIIDILVEINDGKNLSVGDDVMHIVVSGDIRDRVIPVLSDVLNAIKKNVTKKTEFFVDA